MATWSPGKVSEKEHMQLLNASLSRTCHAGAGPKLPELPGAATLGRASLHLRGREFAPTQSPKPGRWESHLKRVPCRVLGCSFFRR